MNRFLLLALTAGLLSPIATKAETWTQISNFYEGRRNLIRWIDVKSIVKNGDWVYANMQRGSGFNYELRSTPNSVKVNCKKTIFKDERQYNSFFSKRNKKGLWETIPDDVHTSVGKKNYETLKAIDPDFFRAVEDPTAEGAYQLLCKKWKY